MNTLTEALSKLEKIEKPVEENKVRLSREQRTLKESLMRKVNQVNTAKCRSSFELTKAYEKALQEGINNVYPDIHWSDATKCDIFSTLLITNNDIDETVNRILLETTSSKKKSNPKTLNESTRSLKEDSNGKYPYLDKYYNGLMKPDAEEIRGKQMQKKVCAIIDCSASTTPERVNKAVQEVERTSRKKRGIERWSIWFAGEYGFVPQFRGCYGHLDPKEVLDFIRDKDYDEVIFFTDDDYRGELDDYPEITVDTNIMAWGYNESLAEDEDECYEESLKPQKKKLSEGRWDYTLQSGRALRDAIESGDLYYVKNALINSYKELEQAGIIDEYDCEQYCDEVEEIDTDDDGAEELLDYELNDFYDLCDNSNVWVSLTEALDEDVQEDPTPREILQGLKDGMSIGEAAGLDD